MQDHCQKSDRKVHQIPIAERETWIPEDGKMTNYENDKTLHGPPFTLFGEEMFGPVPMKEDRKELKRFEALFTCLATRAVHIECTCSIDTEFCAVTIGSILMGGWGVRGAERTQKHLQRNRSSKYSIFYSKYECRLHRLARKPTTIQSQGRCLGEAGSVNTEHSVVSLEYTWKIIN